MTHSALHSCSKRFLMTPPPVHKCSSVCMQTELNRTSAQSFTVHPMLVRDLEDGERIDHVLLVREREMRRKRDGGDYLRLVLGDRTGTVPANLWDDVSEIAKFCQPGVAIKVGGRLSVHTRYGPQLQVEAIREAEPNEYNLSDLLDGPPRA